MSLVRGQFGIEHFDDGRSNRPIGPFAGWTVVLVLLAAAISLSVNLCRRGRTPTEGGVVAPPASPSTARAADNDAPVNSDADDKIGAIAETEIAARPLKVRNLLLRLDAAMEKGNIEMAVSTIEALRALPGEPVADIDDKLARQLGEFNFIWLFERKNAQWVSEVTVKSGDSASRIAFEHGSTLASLRKLNGGIDLDRLRAGRDKVYVMNHPRFSLVVHALPRVADLQLNGKFFKRYYLSSARSGNAGAYDTPANLRSFLAEKGLWFKLKDRNEIEMLMPRNSRLIVSDL